MRVVLHEVFPELVNFTFPLHDYCCAELRGDAPDILHIILLMSFMCRPFYKREFITFTKKEQTKAIFSRSLSMY